MSVSPLYMQALATPTPAPALTPLPDAFTPGVMRGAGPMLAPPGRIGLPPIPRPKNIGTPSPSPTPHVPAQPHIEPPEYDAGLDPAWHGILDPNDHALRNALSGMSPEVRQLLLMRLGKIAAPQTTSQAPGNI